MKKYLSAVLVAAVAVFGAVSQAAAYFEQGNLVRVVYSNDGTTEVATDLGTYNSTTLASAVNSTSSISNLLSYFASGTTLSDLHIAYYIDDYYNATTNPDGTGVYTSGVNSTQTNTKSQALNFKNNANSIRVYYNTLIGTSSEIASGTVVGDSQFANSYWNSMVAAGTKIGYFAGFINDGSGESTLKTGSASADYVDMYMFYYSKPTTSGSGTAIATIRTYVTSDGTLVSVINPSTNAVPIPGAVWLLGSGLLGLMGARRKHS